ncbi:MAG: tRNA (adenosine(37)-N6)-threonylcarbamoyltransferase complex dimerization subunit type 1 TsaB [Chloroflexota bacterium]|nr:tRNA (adenosine(37)-N6)-threonylcarbamoyltransferase complex dimerization subunit type 1 TsaB [Chloroflexota bacterium]MDE2959386.1 tRNA (adenosine(37)-N6)-threonylcarbamoyltransferase complex dimerization subunit type 1 TsaB [Chloroflexota bacterium]
MLLSIDTSSRYGGAALSGSDGQVIEARMWRSTANHTAQLMPAVTELLSARGIKAAELTGVAVALGPGPFSALRVGVSAAKGLAMAGGFPIIGVDTLLLEAWRYLGLAIYGQPSGQRGTVSWLDAGRNEVAAGMFGSDGKRLREDRVAPPSDLLQQDDEGPLPTAYCGEAAWARREEITSLAGDGSGRVVMPWTPADRLWALAEVAARRMSEGQTDDLTTLQPYYLRMPTIGAPRRRDRVRQGRPASR